MSIRHRGKGVGRELMDAAFAWDLVHGCTEAASDARPDRHGLDQRTFAAPGFEDAGVMRCFRRSIQ
ncbi:MAG: GNAT family N-acetyltransferase [Phycisphaerales bacterium]